jgi:hypothetical protein
MFPLGGGLEDAKQIASYFIETPAWKVNSKCKKWMD